MPLRDRSSSVAKRAGQCKSPPAAGGGSGGGQRSHPRALGSPDPDAQPAACLGAAHPSRSLWVDVPLPGSRALRSASGEKSAQKFRTLDLTPRLPIGAQRADCNESGVWRAGYTDERRKGEMCHGLERECLPRMLNSRESFGRAGAERMRQASHDIAAHGYAACARSGRARKRWLMRNGCDLGRTLLL